MGIFATKARRALAGVGFMTFVAIVGFGVYEKVTGSCCQAGAACCYPGSPCCHGHGGVASR